MDTTSLALHTNQSQPETLVNWPPASQTIDFPAFEAMLKQYPALQAGPGSISWKINGEKILVLGWGRAILMQIAHPMVAEGVAQHSHFSKSANAKITRFERTLNRMLEMTFGNPAEIWKAAHKIDQIHARVNADSPLKYSARDPELLKWVHCTFVDSMLKTYELFIAPLTKTEKDQYVAQSAIAAPLLGAPLNYFPVNKEQLDKYMTAMLKSGILKVNAQTRSLAGYVLEGLDIPIVGLGLNWYGNLTVAGLLPPALKKAYRLKQSYFDQIALKSTAWAYRQLHPTLPDKIRRWEIALNAEKSNS